MAAGWLRPMWPASSASSPATPSPCRPTSKPSKGVQQLTATYDAAIENMRLDFTFRFDDITVQGDLAAVRATSQGTITIRATGETQPARLRQLFVLERMGADWKIAQYMYQQMPEQTGGDCSGIWPIPPPGSGPSPSSASRRPARRGADPQVRSYLPAQGPCR